LAVFGLPPQEDAGAAEGRRSINGYPQIVAPQIEPEIAKRVGGGHLNFWIVEP
jgi:hypothetical protein